jgi:hypothetical protein
MSAGTALVAEIGGGEEGLRRCMLLCAVESNFLH